MSGLVRVTDDELDQWAKTRSDDAGRVAKELISYRRNGALIAAQQEAFIAGYKAAEMSLGAEHRWQPLAFEWQVYLRKR